MHKILLILKIDWHEFICFTGVLTSLSFRFYHYVFLATTPPKMFEIFTRYWRVGQSCDLFHSTARYILLCILPTDYLGPKAGERFLWLLLLNTTVHLRLLLNPVLSVYNGHLNTCKKITNSETAIAFDSKFIIGVRFVLGCILDYYKNIEIRPFFVVLFTDRLPAAVWTGFPVVAEPCRSAAVER